MATLATINARVGTTVRLSSLSSADMNGKLGVIESTNIPGLRHVVLLESGNKVRVKPDNLEIIKLPAWPVNLRGLVDLQRSLQEARCMILQSLVAGTFELKWRAQESSNHQFLPLANPEDVFALPVDSLLQILWRDPKAKKVPERQQKMRGLPGPEDKGQNRLAGTLEFT